MSLGRAEGRGKVARCALLCGALLAAWGEQAHAQPVPIEVANREQKNVARKQMQLGIDLFKAEKYQEALEMLRMSHEKVASPNTRLMIANTLVKLEQYPAAHAELIRVIEEAEPLSLGEAKYEKTVTAAKAVLDSIKDKLAFVELEVGARVLMNGEPLAPESAKRTLALAPGKVTFELDAGEGHEEMIEVELEAGQTHPVVLELQPPQPLPPPPPAPPPPAEPKVVETGVSYSALGWTGVGLAGAGALGFTAFGLMASSRHDDLQSSCNGNQCPEWLRDTAEEGRSFQTWANVSLGVGVVGLIGATVFLLAGDGEPAGGVEASVARQADADASTERHADAADERRSSIETLVDSTRLELGLGGIGVGGQF